MRESFAMQRERVAVAVERQRELDELYNPHHHLLNACTIDDLALVQYLVQEEGCDIEVSFFFFFLFSFLFFLFSNQPN